MTVLAISDLVLFPDTPNYEYRLTLSHREYVLRVDWNGREDRWYLELLDANKKPISGRRKIVCGKPLLRHCHNNPSCPPGDIVAVDERGSADSPGAAPSFQELGRRVKLQYIAVVAKVGA